VHCTKLGFGLLLTTHRNIKVINRIKLTMQHERFDDTFASPFFKHTIKALRNSLDSGEKVRKVRKEMDFCYLRNI
jgi:hypothetical protein